MSLFQGGILILERVGYGMGIGTAPGCGRAEDEPIEGFADKIGGAGLARTLHGVGIICARL